MVVLYRHFQAWNVAGVLIYLIQTTASNSLEQISGLVITLLVSWAPRSVVHF